MKGEGLSGFSAQACFEDRPEAFTDFFGDLFPGKFSRDLNGLLKGFETGQALWADFQVAIYFFARFGVEFSVQIGGYLFVKNFAVLMHGTFPPDSGRLFPRGGRGVPCAALS